MRHKNNKSHKEFILYIFKEDRKNFGVLSELYVISKTPSGRVWKSIKFEFESMKTST